MAFFGFKDLSSLSNVDMTIYSYVTQNNEKVAYMRVRDIAKNAHVSNSSVMRFVHKVGFSSFPEFKAFIKNKGNGYSKNSVFNFVNKNNFPINIENKISVAADFLYQADNIILIGVGSSAFLAGYTARRLATLGYNTNTVSDPFYPLSFQLHNTSNNALIVFSVTGETSELIELLNNFVNDGDTTIISITGNEASTIGKMSRYCLSYKETEYHVYHYYDLSSQIPAVYIAEGITHALQDKSRK